MTGVVTIYPDAGDAQSMCRLDVVKPAYGSMHPVSACDPGLLLETLKVSQRRLVAPDLLP